MQFDNSCRVVAQNIAIDELIVLPKFRRRLIEISGGRGELYRHSHAIGLVNGAVIWMGQEQRIVSSNHARVSHRRFWVSHFRGRNVGSVEFIHNLGSRQ